MPLPTRSNVETLDYSLGAQPAAVLEAKNLSSGTLDYSLQAQPVDGLAPSATGGQTLTQTTRFDNTNTFYAADITVGAVTLTQTARFDNANTFYAADINTGQTLLPPLYTNTNTFYGPTVTPGAVTIAPALYANTNALYSASLTSLRTLAPALYSNPNTFYGPAVTISDVIAPALYANPNTFYRPKVTQSADVLVGGGGGEDSYSSKTPNPRGRVKGIGFANERAQHEAALLARFEKTSNTLSDSKLLSARQTAKKLNAYISDKGTAEALQKQLDKLQAQLSVKLSNDDNQNQLNADLQAAADEVQEFIRDEQDAIDLLTFNDEKENELLLMFAGF